MTNAEIAEKINEIGEMLEILDENSFKITAYERAARIIEMTSEPLENIYQDKGIKGLDEINGIGESISEKIEELLKTGKIKYHSELLKKVPAPIIEFTKIPGVGPKTAKKLYDTFHVKKISDLKSDLKSSKKIDVFKKKTRENILRGIDILSHQSNRMLLSVAQNAASPVLKTLKSYPEVKFVDVVGSLRRMQETIGDVDVVVAPKTELRIKNQELSKQIIDKFVKEDFVKKIVSQGETKATIINQNNIQIDLEILPVEEYGSLLQHFTGSKEHNIALRTYAEKQGFSISEHGIKRLRDNRKLETRNSKSETNSNDKIIKCRTEDEVYKVLGMQVPPPEMRENHGEIELALKHQLPKLIELNDIKGDLQMHTTYSDGADSVEEMARACKKLGYEYMAITDHPSTLGVTQGVKPEDVDKYIKDIHDIAKKVGIHIFAGIEANIRPDGTLDLDDKLLAKFDLVFGAVHSSFHQEKSIATKRLLTALANPRLDILGHPSGRVINRRPSIEVDWQEVFKTAKKFNKILEIDAYPDRLDLNDIHIKEAISYKVKLVIDTDSHYQEHLINMRYGVAQARRGWAQKKDIINTLSLNEILQVFKK